MSFKKLLLTAIVIFISYSSHAQIYNYYQIFIYNFAKYIQWPDEKQKGDFVIGVYGNSPITTNLQNMAATKKAGAQNIKVVTFESTENIEKCHMLFLPAERSKTLEEIKTKLNNASTLLITENAGLGKKGSNINFIVVDGKLRFELNREATEKANLKIASDLTKLAILI